MSTIGELSDFGAADLIELLGRGRRSGKLIIKIDGKEVHLTFQNGQIVQVSSTDITLRLGRMLVRQGLLNSAQLLAALHDQASTRGPKPLGQILVERGWITQKDIVACVEEQSIEVMARALGDEPGMFVFESGVNPFLPAEPIALDPVTLLAAASERVRSLRLIRSQLPVPTTTLRLRPASLDSAPVIHTNVPEEMVIAALGAGARTLEDLRYHVSLDEMSLSTAVLSLIERGSVTMESERARAEKSGSGGSAEPLSRSESWPT
jgi:Domain of unknown function (DUF4388)